MQIGTIHGDRLSVIKQRRIFMENFDILENSKTKDFVRFVLALSVGVVLALSSVLVLGIISL
jgi:hypothetical protein